MLNVIFGSAFCDECVMDNRIWFRQHKKPEWFETDFAKRVIRAIDKADVLFEEALKDRWGHGMSTDKLCTGTKSLLCIYNSPETIFNGTLMGDNCIPFLMEIARERDVSIMLECFMDFREEDIPYLRVNGEPVTMYEYECCYSDWCEWVDTESEYYYEQLARGNRLVPTMPRLPRDVEELKVWKAE